MRPNLLRLKMLGLRFKVRTLVLALTLPSAKFRVRVGAGVVPSLVLGLG